jgi:tetratricopeptide (TPR) repeat protein/predicted Ser/Thr protein kinase
MIGKTVSHYKILEELGCGGMGVVYKAHDQKLDRTVALKFLPHFMSHSDTQRKRFLREAQAASALDHPNICTIYDIDETTDGQTFIVMHFCGGRPLEEVIAGDELPIDRVVDIAIKVASGLSSAHGRGIVHRDIKPANIIISDDCGVKIIDFGLAKLTGKTAITRDGSAVGTVAYMSPEQVQGGEVDHRADIWSLGAVLYEMVSGMKPYSGDHEAAVIYQILNEEPVPVMSIRKETPEALAKIIHNALARNPADRFASMEEMATALESIGSQAAAATRPDGKACSALANAREALDRQTWAEAFAAFEEADSQTELTADDLDRWATTAFWMNRIDVAISARERSHAKYVKADQPAQAARTAIELAQDNYQKGSRTVCNGWLARAEKLLKNAPDAVENGYMARFKAKVAIEADQDFDTALDHAAKALEIAEIHGDADLLTLATQDRGRVFVLKNQVKEGMALLDEAMAMAISGELSSIVVGMTYCNMISMCEKIADYRRAGEWSDEAVRWCKPHSESAFPGICCVHRAEVMNVRGDWITAESEAERAVNMSEGYSAAIAAEAHYVIGEIKLRQGKLQEAEASFQEAHRQGRQPVPGMALLWLAQGKLDAARSLIDRALSGSGVDLDRIRKLPAGVEIALAVGDMETARSRADELVSLADHLASGVFTAHADHAVGSVALAEGDFEEALRSLGAARKSWQTVNMPYDEARTRIRMATAYWKEGETALAELEVMAARKAFESLGATVDLARADALIKEIS